MSARRSNPLRTAAGIVGLGTAATHDTTDFDAAGAANSKLDLAGGGYVNGPITAAGGLLFRQTEGPSDVWRYTLGIDAFHKLTIVGEQLTATIGGDIPTGVGKSWAFDLVGGTISTDNFMFDSDGSFETQGSISANGTVSGTWAGTTIAINCGGTGATTAPDARTSLGLGTAAVLNVGTSASNVVQLDSGGKLPTSVLPGLALGDTYSVISQAAMLALSAAHAGDIAIRTDQNKTYRLAGDGNPATLSNWMELLVAGESPVQSVNGSVGAVTVTLSSIGAGTVATLNTGTASGNIPVLDSGGGILLGQGGINCASGRFTVSATTGTLGEMHCAGLTVTNGGNVTFGASPFSCGSGNFSVNSTTGGVTIGGLGGAGGLTIGTGNINLGTGTVSIASGFITIDQWGTPTFRMGVYIGGGSLTLNTGNITAGIGGTFTVNGTTGICTAPSFVGSGATLTSLNGSNISSGTIPTARHGTGTASSSTYLRGDQTWATLPAAPVTTVAGRTGAIVIAEGDVTNLTTDLSNKAPLIATIVLTIPQDSESYALNLEMQFSSNMGFSTIVKTIHTADDSASSDAGSTVNARTHIKVFDGTLFTTFPVGGFGTPFYQSTVILDITPFTSDLVASVKSGPTYYRYRWAKSVGDPTDWTGGIVGGLGC